MFRRTQVEATVLLFTSSFREDTIAGILIILVRPGLELRQSIFTEELEVADRLLALSERICREFVFFLRIFESRNSDISKNITELIKQLLKLYLALTERYRERVKWLEEDRDDNSFRCQPEPVDEGNARSRGTSRFSVSKSKIEGLRDLGFTWSKIAAMIGVSRITLHRRIREWGLRTLQFKIAITFPC